MYNLAVIVDDGGRVVSVERIPRSDKGYEVTFNISGTNIGDAVYVLSIIIYKC